MHWWLPHWKEVPLGMSLPAAPASPAAPPLGWQVGLSSLHIHLQQYKEQMAPSPFSVLKFDIILCSLLQAGLNYIRGFEICSTRHPLSCRAGK